MNCTHCNGPRFGIDVIQNSPVCIECSRRELDAQIAADKKMPAGWPFFIASLSSARRADGTVHACDLRPILRGRLEPKTIATCYRVARQRGLLIEAGTERSDDHEGKNAGRWEPYYELRSAA